MTVHITTHIMTSFQFSSFTNFLAIQLSQSFQIIPDFPNWQGYILENQLSDLFLQISHYCSQTHADARLTFAKTMHNHS